MYDFLCWTPGSSTRTIGESLQRFVDIDRTLDGGPRDRFGNAVSNGSFSKLIGPGCRVGWAEGTASFAYGLSKALVIGLHTRQLSSAELTVTYPVVKLYLAVLLRS